MGIIPKMKDLIYKQSSQSQMHQSKSQVELEIFISNLEMEICLLVWLSIFKFWPLCMNIYDVHNHPQSVGINMTFGGHQLQSWLKKTQEVSCEVTVLQGESCDFSIRTCTSLTRRQQSVRLIKPKVKSTILLIIQIFF